MTRRTRVRESNWTLRGLTGRRRAYCSTTRGASHRRRAHAGSPGVPNRSRRGQIAAPSDSGTTAGFAAAGCSRGWLKNRWEPRYRPLHRRRRYRRRNHSGRWSGRRVVVEQARRLFANGQRVALVCYSHGLASHLERITANWPPRRQPGYVGEFHDLGKLWGAPEGPDEAVRSDETVQFWEHDLPLQTTDLAAQLEPGHRFDSIVVDEAQDFADAWSDPLLAALKDDETGGIYVFTDEGQRVFNRHGSPHARSGSDDRLCAAAGSAGYRPIHASSVGSSAASHPTCAPSRGSHPHAATSPRSALAVRRQTQPDPHPSRPPPAHHHLPAVMR